MKKSRLYIACLAMSLSWITPMMAWADEVPALISTVIAVPEEEDATATTGPAIEVQQAIAAAEAETKAKAEAEAAKNSNAALRQHVVDYALQFVGGRYVAGGNDPHTGADCSGFTKYVLQHAAGVNMNRSSRAQATQGVAISSSQMQPGDLIFYSSGSRINHVAMYIGNGQIVHASTYKTGIKISQWNYRSPAKIISVLG